jgi:hypothetical protein
MQKATCYRVPFIGNVGKSIEIENRLVTAQVGVEIRDGGLENEG